MNPGPATSVRSTAPIPAGFAGELVRQLPWRPSGGRRSAERDIRRVVAVLVLGRPLELDWRACELAQLEPRAGEPRQPATVSRGAKWPSSAASSSTVPTAMTTSPASRACRGWASRRSGRLLLHGDHERPRLVAEPEIADRPARRPAACRHLDLLDRESGRRGRDAVEERRHLRLRDELRHRAARLSRTAGRRGPRPRGGASRRRPRSPPGRR